MNQLLPYETIVKAGEGDPEAVAAVLSHYAGYIRSCAKMDGQINTCLLYTSLSLVYLPSANGFDKPFAASKFGKTNTENQTVDWSQCAKS